VLRECREFIEEWDLRVTRRHYQLFISTSPSHWQNAPSESFEMVDPKLHSGRRAFADFEHIIEISDFPLDSCNQFGESLIAQSRIGAY
jgi:hypothetical protein